MKRITYLLFLLIIVNTAAAQIETADRPDARIIGSVKPAGKFLAELVYYVDGSDTTHLLNFRNAEYQYSLDLVQIAFKNEPGTLDALFAYLTGDKPRRVKLGTTDLDIEPKRGGVILSTSTGYIYLTRKQVDKLFGR